jgi:succinoglycan biosynthesis transport protein ExoP
MEVGGTLELLMYWRMILQNKLIVASFLVAGVLGSFLFYSLEEPMYRAQAQVFVSTPANSLDISSLATGSSFSQQRVKSYAQIINSPVTLSKVISELGLEMTPEQLSSGISAVAPIDTVLISISVTYEDPLLAAAIANATADQFGQVVSDLEMRAIDIDTPIKVSTVRRAVAPTGPVSPNKSIYLLLGLLFGFASGIATASVRRMLDNTIKDEDDLHGLPLLGAIGYDPAAEEKPLISKLGRYAVRTEAFRTLRTNIKYVIPSIPAKVIAVTSALPSEGKSTTALNLSISIAQGGNRVLIIECDMRRPSVATYLELSSKKLALSYILGIEKKMTYRIIQSQIDKTSVSGLDVLCAGKVPSNPSELLGSSNFVSMIDTLRGRYDYLIVDCPPLLPVTDAAVVATVSDGVLLIVHAGKTRKPEFLGARAAIESVGSRILGVVLNKIPEDRKSYNYGYRYGYSKGYGKTYSSDPASVYAPNADELYRIEREEFFERIAGKKFKDELLAETDKYDIQRP